MVHLLYLRSNIACEHPQVLVWKEIRYGRMSEKEKSMLVSEVNILRELKHPNIVRYKVRVCHLCLSFKLFLSSMLDKVCKGNTLDVRADITVCRIVLLTGKHRRSTSLWSFVKTAISRL
jgi:hypothetical protein